MRALAGLSGVLLLTLAVVAESGAQVEVLEQTPEVAGAESEIMVDPGVDQDAAGVGEPVDTRDLETIDRDFERNTETYDDRRAVEFSQERIDEAAAAASGVDVPRGDGPAYSIDRFEAGFRKPHPDHPPISQLFPVEVVLRRTPSGWATPIEGEPSQKLRIREGGQSIDDYHASAVADISRALLANVHAAGLIGVFVMPDKRDIRAADEQDLREGGNTTLRFEIWTGRVAQVRTIAVGERIKDDWLIDNEAHFKIRRGSPLNAPDEGRPESTDLLDKRKLEDYLHWLNRQPGRYVEAALSSSEDGQGIALDYRVHEMRPWSIYSQVANTGTERTNEWQTRVGLIHRQLTGNDDVFSFEYLNSGVDDVNGTSFSYSAPWFGSERPEWLKKSGYEPKLLSWFNRDYIPWWGNDRMRWKILGSWSRFDARIAGVASKGRNDIKTRDWELGSEFSYNFFQHRNFFIDAFVGGGRRNAQSENQSFGTRTTFQMWAGEFGLQMQRVNEFSIFQARTSFERGSSPSDQSNFDDSSRGNTDDDWSTIHWDVGWSHYLEPLLNPSAWGDPSTARSSTLAHELAIGARGQYAFEYRLVPQVSEAVGGLYSVRGFEPGIAVGDSVYLGSVEYRFHLPRALPIQREPLQVPMLGDFRMAPQQVYGRPDWDLIFRTFVDAGRTVKNEKRKVKLVRPEANETLLAAGVGAEFVFRGSARVRVEWARAILREGGEDESIDNNGRFHFLFSFVW